MKIAPLLRFTVAMHSSALPCIVLAMNIEIASYSRLKGIVQSVLYYEGISSLSE